MTKSDILEHPELRKVWDRLETEAPAVEWGDLVAHRWSPRQRVRDRRPMGLLVAAGAFALVLVVGAVALLAVSPNDPVPGGPLANLDWDLMVTFPAPSDPEAFLDQIEAIDGVRSVDYYPNVEVFSEPPPESEAGGDGLVTTTQAGVTAPVGAQPTTAAALLLLDDLEKAETVAHILDQDFDVYGVTYSTEIAAGLEDRYFEWASQDATVIGEDPLTMQPLPGPEPEFDASVLGTEVVLVRATTADAIPEVFWERSAKSMFEEESNRSLDQPVLHVGFVDEIDTRFLVYGSVAGRRCESILMPGGAGTGGCDDFTPYRYGVSGYGGQEGMVGEVEVEVPEATSVVTISIDDGPALWQRPVAGWALFPAELHDFVEFDVVAYDASGQVIGRWEEQG